MADNYPEIQIEIQPQNPAIQMTVERGGRQETQVQLVSVSDKKYYQSSSTTIISAYGQVSFNFSSFVPQGFTCIGCREVTLININGGSAVGLASKNANITYQNITPNAIRPGEHDQAGYYCTAKATLICVKNGVLST